MSPGLQTRLNASSGCADLLGDQRSQITPPGARADLRHVEQAARDLLEMVNAALEQDRPASQRPGIAAEPVA